MTNIVDVATEKMSNDLVNFRNRRVLGVGNQHKSHDCPHCWRVLYSKGALTRHINDEHWDKEAAE